MNRIIFGIGFCLVVFSFSGQAQDDTIPGIPGYASVSAMVRNLETGEDLYRLNSRKTLVSASLMKLVTTATAIELLGPDFSFATRLWTAGKAENGVLKGDLIVEGGGDPALGSEYFSASSPELVLKRIGEILESEGIKSIEGTILIDEFWLRGSRFPSRRSWEDMGNYYGAPPSALSWRDNSFELVLRSPSDVGQLCSVVSVTPNTTGISFNCRARAAALNKDSAYIYGLPGLDEWEIRGSIPAGRDFFSIKGALPEPGFTLVNEIKELLPESEKNAVKRTLNQDWKHKAKLIGQLNSPPLSDIIRETNVHSINLAADHLLVALGRLNADSIISEWDLGLQTIKKFWKEKTGDYYINIKDGSGLAPLNTLSAGFLVDILDYMYHESPNFGIYKNALARSGRSGTLRYLWRQKDMEGNVYGKSGSMQDVTGYSGYVFRPGNPPLAFAFLVNHHGRETREMREIIESWLLDTIN